MNLNNLTRVLQIDVELKNLNQLLADLKGNYLRVSISRLEIFVLAFNDGDTDIFHSPVAMFLQNIYNKAEERIAELEKELESL